jgi:transposase
MERKSPSRKSKLDDYKELVHELLGKYPYTAEQVYARVHEAGFKGSYSTVSRYVKEVRPKPVKAFFKLHFSPGEAAQVDFGYCGKILCDNRERKLIVFVMVLCHSRYLYAEFIPCETQEHFLSSHYRGFQDFGGVPEKVIVDNCKCAVTKNSRHEPVVYNNAYLDFSTHCGFKPEACNPYSPNEKGIVENAVKYIKSSFMTGRKFGSIAEANTALRFWLDNVANVRKHRVTDHIPREVLEEERLKLSDLPVNPPVCSVIRQGCADSRCRVWFDANSYSVPSRCASQKVMIKAETDKVIIYYKGGSVAIHNRSYGRKVEVVDPDHQQDIRRLRQKANKQNLIRDFLSISPNAEKFMEGLKVRELNVELHMRKILALISIYGKDAVAEAIDDMIEFNVYRSEYIENRLQISGSEEFPKGTLHVPNAADQLELKLEPADLDIYNIK